MKFLNHDAQDGSRQFRLSTAFSVKLGEGVYEIFMDRSGLSEGLFSILLCGIGTEPFGGLAGLKKRTAPHDSFPLWMMALIVLTTICFFACVFFLFTLVHWMRDTKRKTTIRSIPKTPGSSRPRVGTSRRTVTRHDDSSPGCVECERNAYARIARALSASKRN